MFFHVEPVHRHERLEPARLVRAGWFAYRTLADKYVLGRIDAGERKPLNTLDQRMEPAKKGVDTGLRAVTMVAFVVNA